MNRKIGKCPDLSICLAGVALLAATALAELRIVRGYSYVYPNNPAMSGGYHVTLKRYPQGDTVRTGVQPTDGLYILDMHDLSGGAPSIGETLSVECHNDTNVLQSSSFTVVVDTLPYTFWVPSMVLHNPDKVGQQPFCVSGNVRDTSGVPGTINVAFWASEDTAYDSVPPYRGNVQRDSLRLNAELLADGIQNGETLHFKIYKGTLSDTTSVFTDSSVVVDRRFGNLENDVAWIRQAMIFPKTVLGLHEYDQNQIVQRRRLKNPCEAADLERCAGENDGAVEVIDVSGRRWTRGDFSSLPSGVYLLRFPQEPRHTEGIVLQQH